MVESASHPRLTEIEAVARKVREEYAAYYADEDDTQSLWSWSLGLCRGVSQDLKKALEQIGIAADLHHGMYYGAEDSYADLLAANRDKPVEDCENWNGGWTHWWVVVDKCLIVDITADQFHPSEPHDYGIVLAPRNDSSYQ